MREEAPAVFTSTSGMPANRESSTINPRDFPVGDGLNPSSVPLGLIILKVASRCNLNCTYCYVYNKGDSSWMQRSRIMSDETFNVTLERIRQHCQSSGQKSITLAFHGGEPCLIGVKRFDQWCQRLTSALEGISTVTFLIQTNGTEINEAWAEAFLKHGVRVGVSVDGPEEIHDRFRLDHFGRGSYISVTKGITVLRKLGVPFGILSVVQLGADPIAIHRHILNLGCSSVNYLMPDFTHETIALVRQRYGPTPCADFLIPIFDDWWFNGTMDTKISNFWNMARVIMGGESELENIGNRPAGYAFVETDGDIEGLDVLRVCDEGLAKTGLNVRDAAFSEIARASVLHRQAIFDGMALPRDCETCGERDTCGGGYLPHRYSRSRGFDNPSVWCSDLLKLFALIRQRLGITVQATQLRRQALTKWPTGRRI